MSAPVVVLGAGANELVAAHCLARAGWRVLVLASARAARRADEGWVAPRVMHALGLEAAALQIHRPDPWAAAPLSGGGRLELWQDMARTVESIRRVSPRDAAQWPEFCARMARIAALLEALYQEPPPDPLGREPRDLLQLGRIALRARGMGREGIEDLLHILPMPAADLLDDWFENDVLKGLLAAAGVMHLLQGPRSGGTAFNLLHRHAGNAPGVFRPPRSNLAGILAARGGVEVRADARIARIEARQGRASALVLESGEEIAARAVVCGLDPRRTFGLMDAAWFDPALLDAVRNIRSRGCVARVAFELDGAAEFSTLTLASSPDYVERAYDDAKHGRVSRRPLLEVRAEGSALEVHVQYVPHRVAEESSIDAVRAALGESTARLLAEHVPQLRLQSVALPCDLEEVEGWPQGQAHHAELALDQAFWMRPLPQLARYRTPVAGLYLCGPAMHPGAGIAGAAGYLCAREVLRDLRKRHLAN